MAARLVVGGCGVGHLEHAGDAAQDGGAAAGLQIFLVLVAGLAEMHLAVDGAGQHMQALGLENLRRLGAGQGCRWRQCGRR